MADDHVSEFAPAGAQRFYCEWVEPHERWLFSWGEPLNTLTNLGFIAVGLWSIWLATRLYRGARLAHWDIYWLGVFITLIGLGSGLFHMTQRYVMADVLPIVVTLISYLAVWCVRATPWRLFGRKWLLVPLSISVFLAVSIALPLGVSQLTSHASVVSTSGYGGAWLFLLGMGFYSWHVLRRPELLWATTAFTLSLGMRLLDAPTCQLTHGQGLHTFWHIFNATAFFFAMRFLFRLRP